ncbi:MAG: dihydroorotase [Thiolinea sp.]
MLAMMERIGLPLLVHGEVVDPDIDIFDREAVFIERKLLPIRQAFPELNIVFEHLTTRDGVDYVQSCSHHTAATVTPHHLVINRNALLVGGIRPCIITARRSPSAKPTWLALVAAALSGDPRFFLGKTDSAPHLDGAKESACGCAGIFNAANAIVTAQVFEQAGAIDKTGRLYLPAWCGFTASANGRQITRCAEEPIPPMDKLQLADGTLTPFDPLLALHWRVE